MLFLSTMEFISKLKEVVASGKPETAFNLVGVNAIDKLNLFQDAKKLLANINS